MKRKAAVFLLASLMSTSSLFAFAAYETATDPAVPPAALPGLNQGKAAQSNEDKADKKGEEASGSNSGADTSAAEKDAATSSGSPDEVKEPKQ
ncbi:MULTISPECIES: hypothetical protein [unclassified Pseudomonas]|jgi:hypothetical protein|uniref:hypothetical protein n=1 Tax=unclassified Pseudomonas TaxID=196821 RepID=UPI000703656E|nr:MULTISPECIES: hypothetical protein [unclassified Pseudomonas]KQZ78625.1 hypothetical protein ASD60_16955 [Pseudomonas sp. Root562]